MKNIFFFKKKNSKENFFPMNFLYIEVIEKKIFIMCFQLYQKSN